VDGEGDMELYPWQRACLDSVKVKEGANVVISAPTGAGKSLVGDLLMARRLESCPKCKALFVLPYVSLIQEKVRSLNKRFGSSMRIEGFYGGNFSVRAYIASNVLVCTIEKAYGLVMKSVQERTLNQFSVIIVDELHMISNGNRGFMIECILSQIRYLQSSGLKDPQIIGMSATISNCEDLASWLNAEVFFCVERPVSLSQFLVVDGKIFDERMVSVRQISVDRSSQELSQVFRLCQECCSSGESVLIFCTSRTMCQNYCLSISKILMKFKDHIPNDVMQARKNIVAKLAKTSFGVDPILKTSLLMGVGYHHAGLTSEERLIIEEEYTNRNLLILVATSTLAAGVNLPVKRVLIAFPSIGTQFFSSFEYTQMSGRAGRPGFHTSGESFLLSTSQHFQSCKDLIQNPIHRAQSTFISEKEWFSKAVLDFVSCLKHCTPVEVENFVISTLFFVQTKRSSNEEVASELKEVIRMLKKNEFIKWKMQDMCFVSTKLGHAALGIPLSPAEISVLFEDLYAARQNFMFEEELYSLYLLSPVDHSIEIHYDKLLEILSTFSESRLSLISQIGVSVASISKLSSSLSSKNSKVDVSLQKKIRRLWVSLILLDLIEEVPFIQIHEKYGVAKGPLQALKSSIGSYAGMISFLCKQLNWLDFDTIFSEIVLRLSHCVKSELLVFMECPEMTSEYSRALYNSGIRNLKDLACADESVLTRIYQCLKAESLEAPEEVVQQDISRRISRWIVFCRKKLRVRKEPKLSIQKSRDVELVCSSLKSFEAFVISWMSRPVFSLSLPGVFGFGSEAVFSYQGILSLFIGFDLSIYHILTSFGDNGTDVKAQFDSEILRAISSRINGDSTIILLKAKQQLKVLNEVGLLVSSFLIDPELISRLLAPDNPSAFYLEYVTISNKFKQLSSLDAMHVSMNAWEKQMAMLKSDERTFVLYKDIESPLIGILSQMESHGIGFSKDIFRADVKTVIFRIEYIEAFVNNLCKTQIDLL